MQKIARLLVPAGIALLLGCSPCLAWGNEGHEIIGTVAANILQDDSPETLKRVKALLRRDHGDLTDHDIASEATWADAFRESSPENKKATREWHFVDIDLAHPDLD